MNEFWWQEAIIYQIYPKSYKDSNQDGIGDIQGIISSLDYIQNLGINTIWLNPIFISPQIDNGYDISNYYAIDDIFGTLEEVEKLIDEAHKRDIKIIFDLVLNHTSSQHPWFQEALKGKNNMYRDYYLWSEPSDDGSVPNNWASFFGGSVWEKDESSNQYYFHLFDKEMPDLNWENLEVQKAMLDIAKYWLDKGIDGFRLDAFIHIAKDDFGKQMVTKEKQPVIAEEYYANLPDVKPLLSQFVKELKQIKPDIFILGEAASASPSKALDYMSEDLCGAIISFDHFRELPLNEEVIKSTHKTHQLDHKAFKKSLIDWQQTLTGEKYPTLYWNNHDMPRVVSRFGEVNHYRNESAKSLATAMYLLKGIPIIYYGEEIGIKNLDVTSIDFFEDKDVVSNYEKLIQQGENPESALFIVSNQHKEVSRGGMQWNATDFSNFSTVAPWNAVNKEKIFNVYEQERDQESILAHYRKLIQLKKQPVFQTGEVIWLDSPPEVIAYKRVTESEEMVVIANISDKRFDNMAGLFTANTCSSVLLGNRTCVDKGTIEPYDFVVFKK
ncbi:alpha-glucosidase [Vagococcus luciliae]|uniref:Oligo-1,6-glucosidase n=1 Tax=Vagococcus luciliae TaxID=2920380 RepID=A0ABY5NYK1_9ENTE|nr:alpha-glucosidase [Vagococcus luciliae]UUV98735.1 Oligo-1,6-glucosidase [Vagococcus luciliae]